MPNLAEHAVLATDDGFRRRLQAAIVQKAVIAADEPRPSGTPTENQLAAWRERRVFAAGALASPAGYVERFAWPVAANRAVLDASEANPVEIPDETLEAALDAAWTLQIKVARADGA